MVIGYLLIFILVLTASVCAISQLRGFKGMTPSVFGTDNRILEYERDFRIPFWRRSGTNESSSLRKSLRYYVCVLTFKGDFEKYLEEANSVRESAVKVLLEKKR